MTNPNLPVVPLGAIYLPSNPGTPVGRFDFIVDTESGVDVEIGTPVAADTSEGTVVGAVVDMRTVGLGKDPVASELGGSYETAFIAQIPEVMVATVQVFHSKSMRPVRAGIVRAARPDEMLSATGFFDMDWPVPAGVVPMADGSFAKVCFDGHALLGPESAHLTVGGLSGQAAKTSYAAVLLKAAIESGATKDESTAALIFNVKGEDLIYMDETPVAGYELQDSDLAMYEAMGIPATPFDDVTVYSPSLPGGRGTQSPRIDALPMRWDLLTVWKYLRYFLGESYHDEKVQSFITEFASTYVFATGGNPNSRISTFAQLDQWFADRLAEAEVPNEDGKTSSMFWRSHHKATGWRIRRLLGGIVTRSGGLVTKETSDSADDIPVTGWMHGQVVVVDIAGLPLEVQSIVIARTMERVLKSAEAGELGVSHIVTFWEEANALIPQSGGAAQGAEVGHLKRMAERVATQGRYAGISMWTASQAPSRVSEMVTSNAASRALGRTSDLELASGAYGRLPAGIVERIATMPKGQMMLWHYSFRAPLMVKFPRPAWRTGKPKTSGNAKPKIAGVLGMRMKSVERLTEGIHPDQVAVIVSAADDPDVARAALEKARIPDMKKNALHEANAFDPDNPFDLGD